jgi:flagellar M-ring protein FliF
LAGIGNQALSGSTVESGGQNASIEGGGQHAALPEEEEVSDDLYMKKLSPEARAKMKASDRMTQEVITFVEESPDNATKLLRSWITQAGVK